MRYGPYIYFLEETYVYTRKNGTEKWCNLVQKNGLIQRGLLN
jgi:hypothetical protein